jgi:alpha-tubulin suppressor-like RCC1 family protein
MRVVPGTRLIRRIARHRGASARGCLAGARAGVRVRAALAAMAGLAVIAVAAAATAPALAAQHPAAQPLAAQQPAAQPPAAQHSRAQHPAAQYTDTQHRGRPAASTASPSPQWTAVAAGQDQTCGIRADGTLWCWGGGFSGELGIGSRDGRYTPSQVTSPAPGGWTSVTAGQYFTCATRIGGTLWCWGNNGYGELGIGSLTEQDLPQQVTTPAAGGWASVTAGFFHTCATRTDGTLWCWGYNSHGQLGLGNLTTQDLPQQVTTPAPEGWASASATSAGTCAVRTGGTLWCWGANNFGQLGLGSQTNQARPRQVTTPAADGWASVAAESMRTCALRTGGTLWCWGDNSEGELGLGNQTSQDLPQQVTSPAAAGWAGVSGGFGSICATRTGGTLWCWGDNGYGELGIASHVTHLDLPRQVVSPAAAGWASVAAGGWHACAIRTGGALWCWGDNGTGQLGIGHAPNQYLPRHVGG